MMPFNLRRLINSFHLPEGDPVPLSQRAHWMGRLTAALLALPCRDRLILTLSYYEELTNAEIGVILGETESTCSEMKDAALLQLESQLADLRAEDPNRREV